MSKARFTDAIGNTLEPGNEVLFTGRLDIKGKIVSIEDGGLSVVELDSKRPQQTPAKIHIRFDVLLFAQPEGGALFNYYRVVNPESEEVIKKALGSDSILKQ